MNAKTILTCAVLSGTMFIAGIGVGRWYQKRVDRLAAELTDPPATEVETTAARPAPPEPTPIPRPDYEKLSHRYRDADFDAHFEDSMPPTDDLEGFRAEPYLVDLETYRAGDGDAECLVYYQQDGILADERGDVIFEQRDTIGDDALEIIDETTLDTLYVRNDPLDIWYEVAVNHNDSYYRDAASAHI